MKSTITLILLMMTQLFFAQTENVKKPQNVIIINNEIVTMQQVEKYGADGYVKSMSKGVSEEQRNELAKKFGDKIGDKEFIIMVSLFSEKEKIENYSLKSSLKNLKNTKF